MAKAPALWKGAGAFVLVRAYWQLSQCRSSIGSTGTA